MARMRVPALAWISALALLGVPSCSTNTKGDDASPVYYSASHELLPAQKIVNSGTALQLATTTLRSILKSPTATASRFLDSNLDSYTISWVRIDGGTKAPGREEYGGNVLVPAGGASTLSNYQFMSASSLELPPFDQLFPFNGGFDRETGKKEIRCRALVTYFGHTLAGQAVTGTSNFDMTFLYVPTTGGIEARVSR